MRIEEHAIIEVKAEGGILAGYPFAPNDIAVLKRDDASMISIRTQCGWRVSGYLSRMVLS